MAKNIMANVARQLGVELDEKFKIKGIEGWTYKFDDDDIIVMTDQKGRNYACSYSVLCKLLKGDSEIVKLPWRPKKGEVYYITNVDGNILSVRWNNDTFDNAFKALGMIYRTREEAEAHMKDDYRKLTDKEWEE
jgi:hypothetical protein